MKIDPVEQYAGGQVDLYGDGFGELVEVAAGATITVDSTNGSNVAGNAVDRLASTVWASNGGAAAWIRFTFGAPKTIVAIALEGSGSSWGVPEFRFSDGGANINGGTAVPAGAPVGTEYPVGTSRTLYALPAPRTTTYVEIRIASGGSGTRGLYEVWIYEDLDDLAETSRVWLNFGQPAVTDLGIVAVGEPLAEPVPGEQRRPDHEGGDGHPPGRGGLGPRHRPRGDVAVAIRTSEGIYLEVLQLAPVAGVPVEIDVYAGNNVATMLATLEGAQAPAFTDPFGDIGSGHFRSRSPTPRRRARSSARATTSRSRSPASTATPSSWRTRARSSPRPTARRASTGTSAAAATSPTSSAPRSIRRAGRRRPGRPTSTPASPPPPSSTSCSPRPRPAARSRS